MSPHAGYGVTFVLPILLIFVAVFSSNRGCLVKRTLLMPQVLLIPIVAIAAVGQHLCDWIREHQIQTGQGSYLGEFGLLHYSLELGQFLSSNEPFFELRNPTSFLIGLLPLLHTFVFPVIALFDPGAYVSVASPRRITLSWNAYAWDALRTQFHGGILALVLISWSFARNKKQSENHRFLLRCLAITLCVSICLALLMTPKIRWFSLLPEYVFGNAYWQTADVSLLLTLSLAVIHGDRFSRAFPLRQRNSHRSEEPRSFLRRCLSNIALLLGLLITVSLLPYRLIEPIRINGGQTRFSPLQLDGEIRKSNESWEGVITRIASDLRNDPLHVPERVLIGDGSFVMGEGEQSWWGLRTFTQLRDIQLSSLLSRPRFRDSETLTRHAPFSSTVESFRCTETIRSTLDVLSVGWAILPKDCAQEYLAREYNTTVAMPEPWSNLPAGRPFESVSPTLLVRNVSDDQLHLGVRLREFHHWWAPIGRIGTEKCPFLELDCATQLELVRGSSTSSPPMSFCVHKCVARYHISENAPAGDRLIVPLNFDASIRARQGEDSLRLSSYHGLVAIDAESINAGEIEFFVEPDVLMRIQGFVPIAWLFLIFLATRHRYMKSRYPKEQLNSPHPAVLE
jgi:hypothetical protein